MEQKYHGARIVCYRDIGGNDPSEALQSNLQNFLKLCLRRRFWRFAPEFPKTLQSNPPRPEIQQSKPPRDGFNGGGVVWGPPPTFGP